MFVTIFVTVLLIAADQLTKYLAVLYLQPVGVLPFIPGVMQLEFFLNDGAAFSFLSGVPGGRYILIVVTGIALLVLGWILLFKKPQNRWEYIGWLLVFGGGLGNLIDRVRTGVVVDFFAVTFMDFAVFNVADCFVVVGVGILFAAILWQEWQAYKRKKQDADTAL